MKAYFRRIKLARDIRDIKCLGFGQVQTKGREVPTELEISRLPPASGSKLHFCLARWESWSFPGDPTIHLCVSCHQPFCFCAVVLHNTSRSR